MIVSNFLQDIYKTLFTYIFQPNHSMFSQVPSSLSNIFCFPIIRDKINITSYLQYDEFTSNSFLQDNLYCTVFTC